MQPLYVAAIVFAVLAGVLMSIAYRLIKQEQLFVLGPGKMTAILLARVGLLLACVAVFLYIAGAWQH